MIRRSKKGMTEGPGRRTRWERDAGTASDGRGTGGAEEEPMEVALEEPRFPGQRGAVGPGGVSPRPAAQTLGKGRGWRRGGVGREGRGRGAGGQPARAMGNSRETSGARSQPVRRRRSLAGTLLSCPPPAHAPFVSLSRLHRPRLRVTPVPAAGPGLSRPPESSIM